MIEHKVITSQAGDIDKTCDTWSKLGWDVVSVFPAAGFLYYRILLRKFYEDRQKSQAQGK